jgi:hypothetical protein
LFEGLYIYDKWDWTRQYPVIRIDWTDIQHFSKEEMEEGMSVFLRNIAGDYGITFSNSLASNQFGELIKAFFGGYSGFQDVPNHPFPLFRRHLHGYLLVFELRSL